MRQAEEDANYVWIRFQDLGKKQPVTPPRSAILARPEKSYACVTAAATPFKLVIASLKIAPSLELVGSHSKWQVYLDHGCHLLSHLFVLQGDWIACP